MFCVLICYVMPGCFALSCPKNFSAQSDPELFSASDTDLKLDLLVCDFWTETCVITDLCNVGRRGKVYVVLV